MFVPLNRPANNEHTNAFAHAVAESLEREFPKIVVSRMQKNLRVGKILVDWNLEPEGGEKIIRTNMFGYFYLTKATSRMSHADE